VNSSNVVEISQEVKNLSSVKPGRTLQSGDIANIAKTLEKIADVKEKANEVGYDHNHKLYCNCVKINNYLFCSLNFNITENIFHISRRLGHEHFSFTTIQLEIYLFFMIMKVSEDFFTTVDNVLDARIENVLESQKNANSSSR
jgi:hypothetical protein